MTTIIEPINEKCEWPNCDQDRIKKRKNSAYTNLLEAMKISDKFCKEHQKLFKKIRQKEISIEDYIGKILYKKNKEGWISSLGFEKNYNIILDDLLLVKNKLMLLDDINISHIIKTYEDFKLKKLKKFITDTYWKKQVLKPKKYSKIIDYIYTDENGFWILKFKRYDSKNIYKYDGKLFDKAKQRLKINLRTKDRREAIKRIENKVYQKEMDDKEMIDVKINNNRKWKQSENRSELIYFLLLLIGTLISISLSIP